MKRVPFRSIRIRIMTATTLLIVVIVGVVVWSWASNESDVYREQQRQEAQTLGIALSNAWTNELVDQNWSQIRLGINLLLKRNSEFIYILVSDARLSNQIVAALPEDFQEQYVPDVVPAEITKAALEVYANSHVAETVILRNVEFPKGRLRARRGERVIEVASDIRNTLGEKIGTLRIGISLQQVNRAVRNAVNKALLVGALAWGFGLIGAYILAQQLSHP